MLMMHARYYVETAERLLEEVSNINIDVGNDTLREDLIRRERLVQYAALELRFGMENAAYKILH